MRFRTVHLDEAESTNLEVMRAIEAGEPDGLVVVARKQTAGYGRRGSGWESPEGNLYMSVLLRPDKPLIELPSLGLVVALGVRDAAIELLSGGKAGKGSIFVKWPNDVVVADVQHLSCLDEKLPFRKLCGISVEAHKGAVCIGIGLNIASDALELSRAIALEELAQTTISPEVVQDLVLSAVGLRIEGWERDGFGVLSQDFDNAHLLCNRNVVVELPDGALISGVCQSVGKSGQMIVRTLDGELAEVFAGSVREMA